MMKKIEIRSFSQIGWKKGIASQMMSLFIILMAFFMYLWALEVCHTYVCAAKTQTTLDSLIDGIAANSIEVSAKGIGGQVDASANETIQYFNISKVKRYLESYNGIVKALGKNSLTYEFDQTNIPDDLDDVGSSRTTDYVTDVKLTSEYGVMNMNFVFSGRNVTNTSGSNAKIIGKTENTVNKIAFSGNSKYEGTAKVEVSVDLIAASKDNKSFPDNIRSSITPYFSSEGIQISGNGVNYGLSKIVTIINQLNVENRKRYVNRLSKKQTDNYNKSAYFIWDVINCYTATDGFADSSRPTFYNLGNGMNSEVYFRLDDGTGRSGRFADYMNLLLEKVNTLLHNNLMSGFEKVYDGVNNHNEVEYKKILGKLNRMLMNGLVVVAYIPHYEDADVSFDKQYVLICPNISSDNSEFDGQGQKIKYATDNHGVDNYSEAYVDMRKNNIDKVCITYVANEIYDENYGWIPNGDNHENQKVSSSILENAQIYVINYTKFFSENK